MNNINKKITRVFLLVFIFSVSILGFSQTNNTSTSIQKGVSYLKNLENADGGFSEKIGEKSNSRITEWIVLALHSSGEDTSKYQNYILKNGKVEETTDYARTLMALKATGYKGKFKGISLEDKLVSFQKENGQFSQFDRGENEMINAHVWSILALYSAEVDIPKKDKAKDWLLAQQNNDGGFSWQVGGLSDSDSTGVALTALIALGENKENSLPVRKAINYLKKNIQSNGGFVSGFAPENIASTSWALQGLVAAGEKVNGLSLDYIIDLQKKDGSFFWMDGREASQALMTSYALMALNEKPFPVNIDFKKNNKNIILYINNKTGLIGSQSKDMEVPPMLANGRTMVPLRFIAEALDAQVAWESTSNSVTIKTKEKSISLSSPEIFEGRTMVPVRYISENFGAKVSWDSKDKKITIEY